MDILFLVLLVMCCCAMCNKKCLSRKLMNTSSPLPPTAPPIGSMAQIPLDLHVPSSSTPAPHDNFVIAVFSTTAASGPNSLSMRRKHQTLTIK